MVQEEESLRLARCAGSTPRHAGDVPMPYNDNLERAVIPSQTDIQEAVKAVCYR